MRVSGSEGGSLVGAGGRTFCGCAESWGEAGELEPREEMGGGSRGGVSLRASIALPPAPREVTKH